MSKLKDYIEERTIEEAIYIVENNATIRQTANKFGISKSTVAKDMADRLPEICALTAVDVRNVLDHNLSERHIRGGLATQAKYKMC